MKETVTMCATVLLVIATICGTIVAVNFVNRDRPQIDSSEEVYKKECARRGGNITTRNGVQNGISIDEKSCEVEK